MDNRAVRLPPGSRHNLFQSQSSRRQNPPAVRPDREAANIFQQPQEDELVERTEKGEYNVAAPQPVYKHIGRGIGTEAQEEAGKYTFRRLEIMLTTPRTRARIDPAVRQVECALGCRCGRGGDQGCTEVESEAESG